MAKERNVLSKNLQVIIVLAVIALLLLFAWNNYRGQTSGLVNAFASTSTGQPSKTLPPCAANTFPLRFDGNHLTGASGYSMDRALASAVTRDGGYLYVGGKTVPDAAAFREKLWVSKHDNCGNVLWVANFDDTVPGSDRGQFREVTDITLDEARGYIYVVGNYFALPAGDVLGQWNVFVARLEASSGRILWLTTLDYRSKADRGYAVIADGDKLYVTGYVTNVYTDSSSCVFNETLDRLVCLEVMHRDAFIAKYAPPSTEPVWLRIYSSPYVPIQYSTLDEGRDILLHSDGYLYATGIISRAGPFGPKRAVWLAEVNPIDGVLAFQTYYERALRGPDDRSDLEAVGYAISNGDATGSFWVTGYESGRYIHPFGTAPDILLLHFTHAGALLSSRYIDGLASLDQDTGNDVAVLPDGSTFTTGTLSYGDFNDLRCEGEPYVDPVLSGCSNLYMEYSGGWTDLIPGGEIISSQAAEGSAIAVDAFNNVYVAGTIRTQPRRDADFLIAKYTRLGRATS